MVLTGWGVGESYWGGYAQQAQVKADWLVPLPEKLDGRRAVAIGTAGFYAMLCVLALEQAGVKPDAAKPVLVTGASGGVGGVAVALLAHLGYRVTAVTGRPEDEAHLRELGAVGVHRSRGNGPALPAAGGTALVGRGGVRWAAGYWPEALAEADYGGAVAACGLAGGTDLPTAVHAIRPARRGEDTARWGWTRCCVRRNRAGMALGAPGARSVRRDAGSR
ncbi:MAG: hypothetical protein MZW92_47640 [Comamonadaceae bacterium]|nr:hypothetical protein [Comamonadaceae bacterium]